MWIWNCHHHTINKLHISGWLIYQFNDVIRRKFGSLIFGMPIMLFTIDKWCSQMAHGRVFTAILWSKSKSNRPKRFVHIHETIKNRIEIPPNMLFIWHIPIDWCCSECRWCFRFPFNSFAHDLYPDLRLSLLCPQNYFKTILQQKTKVAERERQKKKMKKWNGMESNSHNLSEIILNKSKLMRFLGSLRWLWAMNQMLIPILKKKTIVHISRSKHTCTATHTRHPFDEPLQNDSLHWHSLL